MTLIDTLEKLHVIVPAQAPVTTDDGSGRADDPMAREVPAENLRVGRMLHTVGGWQVIRGLVMFQDADKSTSQVTVFTDERDDVHTDGWTFRFGDPVQTRMEPTAEQEYRRVRQERLERKRRQRAAQAAARCPEWCVEHYDGRQDGERARNHSSAPETVTAAGADTNTPMEVAFWLERRDNHVTGETVTVGVLRGQETNEDVELTPELMLQLAGRLSSLAHRAQLHR